MNKLEELRIAIDECDKIIVDAYCRRLALVDEVGEYKRINGIEILQAGREAAVLEKVAAISGERADDVQALYCYIMDYSKSKQSER